MWHRCWSRTQNETALLLFVAQVLEQSTEGDRSTRFKLGRGRVIKAWDECLIGATKGCRRLVISPASFAYGTEGRGKIPANSTVAFDIEILRVTLFHCLKQLPLDMCNVCELWFIAENGSFICFL